MHKLSNLWKAVLILFQLVKQKMLFFRSISNSCIQTLHFFFIYIIQVLNYVQFFLMVSSGLLEKIFCPGRFFGVSKIAFGGKFSFSRVTGMSVGTRLYSYRSFVLLRPSSEDCLQSVCSKY